MTVSSMDECAHRSDAVPQRSVCLEPRPFAIRCVRRLLRGGSFLVLVWTAHVELALPAGAQEKPRPVVPLELTLPQPRAMVEIRRGGAIRLATPDQQPINEDRLPDVYTRLETYFECQLHWVQKHCQLTPQQVAEIRRRAAERVCSLHAEPRKLEVDFDDAPLRFVTTGTGAKTFGSTTVSQVIVEALTLEQRRQLDAAIHLRLAALHAAVADDALEQLDDQMHFHPEQIDRLKAHLIERLPLAHTPFFSLQPATNFLELTNTIDLLARLPDDEMSAVQQHVRARLRGQQERHSVEQFVVLRVQKERKDDDVSTYHRHVRKSLQHEYDRIAHSQLEMWKDSYQLSEAQFRRLQLAFRGAIQYLLDDSVSTETANVERLRRFPIHIAARGGNDGQQAFVEVMVKQKTAEESQLLNHPLVTQTLSEIRTTNFGRSNLHFDRHVTLANYCTSLLDRELWLTSQQRTCIAKQLKASIGQVADTNWLAPQERAVREFKQLDLALTGLPRSTFESILSPSQLQALDQLKNRFIPHDDIVHINIPGNKTAKFRRVHPTNPEEQ